MRSALHEPETEEGALVLVADDNEDNREICVQGLRSQGFRVVVAGNGREAIASARTHRPDVIVMDIAMPDIDGLQATRLLKLDETTRTIGIVVLSAWGDPQLRERARAAGAELYVQKPCIPSELALHVHESLRLKRRRLL